MKTYLECLDEAAVILKNKTLAKYLKMTLSKPSVELLEKAAEIYAEQSNSHKPVVSGKRPLIAEILDNHRHFELTYDEAIDRILAACASGAEDTVEVRMVELCGSDCCPDDGRCEHCQNPITDERKSSDGQP